MEQEENAKVVRDAYAAFARRDIATLLTFLDDAIQWNPVQGAGPHVKVAGERLGKAAVADFFDLLAREQTFHMFEARQFVAEGDTVAVLGHYVATPHSTGRKFEANWVMVFTMRDGKIVRFQEFTDSAAVNAAWEPA